MGAVCENRLIGVLRRGFAAGSAALIFALGLFAASPALHEHLHDGVDATDQDQCAVVLFASGVSVPLAVSAPLPPAVDWRALSSVPATELLLDSPRYLLQPERGPPVA